MDGEYINGTNYHCDLLTRKEAEDHASAVLVEIDEEWKIGKIHLNMKRKNYFYFYKKIVVLCIALYWIIENGGDPFFLQRILGDTDQTTTSKYVNMARDNLKAQQSQYWPGERLG